MLGSGVFVCLFGLAYFMNLHSMAFFIFIQIGGGKLQGLLMHGLLHRLIRRLMVSSYLFGGVVCVFVVRACAWPRARFVREGRTSP